VFFFNIFFRCVVVVCFLHKFSRRKRGGGGERERRMNKGHNGPTPMTNAPSTGCPLWLSSWMKLNWVHVAQSEPTLTNAPSTGCLLWLSCGWNLTEIDWSYYHVMNVDAHSPKVVSKGGGGVFFGLVLYHIAKFT